MSQRLKVATVGVLAHLVSAAAVQAQTKPAPAAPKRNWNTAVTVTPQGTHILGNPAAEVRLTEFVSYTCPHCAQFETQADGPLRLTFVVGGKGAVEVRHFVRDPVDMTVALLTNCGPADKFFANHTAFLRRQGQWIGPLENPSPAQKARWTSGAFAQRTRAIAKDFGFYPIMQSRGYTASQVDACLANEGLAKRLAASTAEASEKLFVTGTPSFAINGTVLTGTHSWQALRPQLAARMR
jgi:protein-disulfide isomerase